MHKSVACLRIIFVFYLFSLLCLSATAFALPFNVFPQPGTIFPTKIKIGLVAQAFYTVRNNTLEQRNNNYVKYLPPNVVQVVTPGPGNCGTTFNLAPRGQAGDSCILSLNVLGPVNGNDPNPHHHLFVCFPGGLTCAGTNYPLNVTAITISSITVTPSTSSLFTGSTQQYTALANYSDGTTDDVSALVTWQSSNNAVATVTPTGLVTTVGAGTTTVIATMAGVSGTASLTVNAITLVSIAIVPASATTNASQTVQYTATGTFTDGSSVDLTTTATWVSSNVAVATIDANGLATGVDAGTTTITASLNGVISNPGSLTVNNPLVSIDVTPGAATINANQTQQFQAIGHFFNGATADLTNSVTWNSSDTAVATISSSGLATGVSAGDTTITAQMDGIVSNNATLTVLNPLLAIAITPATATITASGTQQYTATGTFTAGPPQNITNSVTWHSSDTTVATISATGLATAVAGGTTNITATSGIVLSNTAVLTVRQFIYIANTTTNNISYCNVDSTGTISGCLTFTDLVNVPLPIQLTIDRKGTHIYISNQPANNTVVVCDIDQASGNLLNCAATGGVTFSTPKGIAINHTNTRAYIVNSAGNNVFVCNINSSSGVLSGCVSTQPNFLGMLGIALNTHDTIAYITTSTGNLVYYCQVDQTNGTLFNCADSGANGMTQPNEIALNTTDTFAYVGNFGESVVRYCTINANGTLSGCVSSGQGSSPKGVTISSTSKLYFTNNTNSTIGICTANANGTLTGCTTIPGTGNPLGISITGHT